MTNLRRSIVILVIFLAVYFDLERLDIGQTNFLNLASFSYVVTTIAILSILVIRFFRYQKLQNLIFFWLIVYLIVQLTSLILDPEDLVDWDRRKTYLMVTELSLMVIGIVLAYDVGRALNDFEEAVHNITLAGMSKRVQTMEQASDEIRRELMRSRRHNYPISLLVVEPDPRTVSLQLNRSVVELQKSMMARYAINDMMRTIGNLLRRTDLVINITDTNNSFAIMSSDTDHEGADLLIKRVKKEVKNRLGINVCCGIATFPEAALTFDELIDAAYEQVQCEKDSPLEAEFVPQ